MSAVRRVNDTFEPTWEDAERLLLQLPDKHGTQVCLEVGDDHWLIVEYAPVGTTPSRRVTGH